MAHKFLIRSEVFPYHVYARSNNRESFYIAQSDFWERMIDLAAIVSEEYRVQFHALVLMPNHFHLLISTPNANLDEAMLYFQRELSRSVNRTAGRINHLFGGRYKWCLIDDMIYYENAYRYLYQNPLRAKLSRCVEDYPYASFSVEQTKPLVLTRAPQIFRRAKLTEMSGAEHKVWINRLIPQKVSLYLGRALRKKRFQLNSRCPLLLEF